MSGATKPMANQHALVAKINSQSAHVVPEVASQWRPSASKPVANHPVPIPTPTSWPISLSLWGQLANQLTAFPLDAANQSEHPSFWDSSREPIRILCLIAQ